MRSEIVPVAILGQAFGEVSRPRRLGSGLHIEIKKCPRCKNDKWKASVNLENGWFFCQACRETGIHINHLIDVEEAAAVRRKPEDAPGRRALPPIPAGCVTIEELEQEHPARQYLRRRGVGAKHEGRTGIRYKKKGVPLWGTTRFCARHSGLIHQITRHGKLTGWQFEAVPRIKHVPKYISAPGSELGSSFFNFDFINKSTGFCIIVEGVYDAYKLTFNALGILGDTISSRQLKLLSAQQFKQAVLILDADRTDRKVSAELSKLKRVISDSRALRLKKGDPADHSATELWEMLGAEIG